MATYQELFAIANDTPPALVQRIRVAITVKAQAIAVDPQSSASMNAWALGALRNPSSDLQVVLNYLLSANKAATPAQITGASDELVQTAVNATVDQLLGANGGE